MRKKSTHHNNAQSPDWDPD